MAETTGSLTIGLAGVSSKGFDEDESTPVFEGAVCWWAACAGTGIEGLTSLCRDDLLDIPTEGE